MIFFERYRVCAEFPLMGKIGKRGFFRDFSLLLFHRWKSRQKIFADMIATRSVRPLTAAAKVNWTLTRFRTPLYEAGHSLRVRTACRHGLRTRRQSRNPTRLSLAEATF